MSPTFCTLFDRNYFLKGMVMMRTLARHCPGARILVLCMDDETYTLLQRLQLVDVTVLRLAEIEDATLLEAKRKRSHAEYCWTLSSCLPWYLFQTHPEIDFVTYLDADLMFFSSVAPVLDEIGSASIAVTEHRYCDSLSHMEVRGRFNVQWVSFRRDTEGLACLGEWRRQCIDWCFSQVEDDRMADQKYLDAWPDRYRSLHVIQHPGAGLAPWNWPRYAISKDESGLMVDGQPLIFYHFHQLQMLQGGKFDRTPSVYVQDGPVPAMVYEPYEQALREALKEMQSVEPGFAAGVRPWLPVLAMRIVQRLLPLKWKSTLRRFIPA